MRGRKARPAALKAAAGNPGKRALKAEPAAQAIDLKAPRYMSADAKGEWDRLVPHLSAAGVATVLDRPLLEGFVTARTRWLWAEAMLRKQGVVTKAPRTRTPMVSIFLGIARQALSDMQRLGSELGLSPTSRARLGVVPGPLPGAEFDEFADQPQDRVVSLHRIGRDRT